MPRTIAADSCVQRRLPTGQSCTITVRFTPSATGARVATIALTDNESPATAIALSGTGVAASSGPPGPQGPAGAQGPQGEAGAAGAQGSAGAAGLQGAKGEGGAAGSQGPQGAAGAAGATGPRGANGARGPAGKVELITCEKAKKGNKITQTCQAKPEEASPIKFTGTGTKVAAALSRGKLLYAAGFAIDSTGGETKLLLSLRRTILKGSYTLTIKRGHTQHRQTITIV